eukprot:gene3890-13956_t
MDWMDAIRDEMLRAGAIIILSSSDYGNTEWTEKECKYAILKEMKIVPLWHLGDFPPKKLDFVLTGVQRTATQKEVLVTKNAVTSLASQVTSDMLEEVKEQNAQLLELFLQMVDGKTCSEDDFKRMIARKDLQSWASAQTLQNSSGPTRTRGLIPSRISNSPTRRQPAVYILPSNMVAETASNHMIVPGKKKAELMREAAASKVAAERAAAEKAAAEKVAAERAAAKRAAAEKAAAERAAAERAAAERAAAEKAAAEKAADKKAAAERAAAERAAAEKVAAEKVAAERAAAERAAAEKAAAEKVAAERAAAEKSAANKAAAPALFCARQTSETIAHFATLI